MRGTTPSVWARASSPASVNGGWSTGLRMDSTELPAWPGMANRWLKLPPPPPADAIISPSKAARPRSSWLKPSRTNSRSSRPLCRVPEAQHAADQGGAFSKRAYAFGAEFQVRREVTNGRQAKSGDRGSLGFVDRFIETARETRRQLHGAALPGELPGTARQDLRRSIDRGAEREHGVGLRRVAGAVLDAKTRVARAATVLDVACANDAADLGDRCVERQPLRGAHVELPSEKRHGEPLGEREAVPQVPLLGRQIPLPRGAHQPERLVAPTVDDFEEHRTAGPVFALRQEEEEIRRKLDAPGGVARRQGDVGDAAIRAYRRIDGEMDTADDPLVRSEVVAAAHLDPHHLRRGGDRTQQQECYDASHPNGRHRPVASYSWRADRARRLNARRL